MKNSDEDEAQDGPVIREVSDAPREVKDMIVKAIMSGNVVWAGQPLRAVEDGEFTREQVEAMILKSIVGGKPN